jgi:RNA polymerase sigma-70 factor, ECF subfamily
MEMRALAEAPSQASSADPDAEFVAAAREEPRAFLALYDRYFERVLGYVRIRIHDPATCEDVTSHVFTTALAQLRHFRGDGAFSGWLFQIARNAVRDVQREPLRERLPETEVGSEPDAEERVLALERVASLQQAVRQLAPDQQHLLALRYGGGLSFAEIGAIVDAAPGTVRVRLHRTLTELRRRYPHDDA